MYIFFAFLLKTYNIVSWSYITSVFYRWFVLIYFPTLPEFGWVQFLGFMLFISVLLPKDVMFVEDKYRDGMLEMSHLVFAPWVTLILGWLLKSIFM